MKKTVILIALSIILTAVCVLPAFAAPTSITVDLRIEGKTENLFYDKVTTNNSLNFNVASILMLADVQSEKLSIDGLSNGYITAISGDAVGQTENGLDTFVIKVNGNYLPYDQISSYQLNDGDDILVYYGILKDDNFMIVAGHDGSRVKVDRVNPRTEIFITRMEE